MDRMQYNVWFYFFYMAMECKLRKEGRKAIAGRKKTEKVIYVMSSCLDD